MNRIDNQISQREDPLVVIIFSILTKCAKFSTNMICG